MSIKCVRLASSQSLLQKRGKSSGWLVQCYEPLAEHIYSFRGDLLEKSLFKNRHMSLCQSCFFLISLLYPKPLSGLYVFYASFNNILVISCRSFYWKTNYVYRKKPQIMRKSLPNFIAQGGIECTSS